MGAVESGQDRKIAALTFYLPCALFILGELYEY